jgi:hypothetical protein
MLKPPQMPPRRDNTNNNNTNNNNTNDVIQQLATAQAQLMQMMIQFIQANANNNNPPPPPPPPQVDRLARFLRLRPNKFSSATDPIVADDWLCSVSKDLITCECTDAEKVRFTAHLLEEPAAMWWETYQVTHPVEGLDWDTFREGFCNAHISTGIMNLKKEEFRTLRQGGRTHMDDFFSLSRYAPDDVDIDAMRKDKFLAGLKGELKIPLSVAYAPNYQALLDQAVTLDNNIRKEENRKRKFSGGKSHTETFHKKHHSSESSGNGSSHRHGGHFNKGNGGNFNGHMHNGGFRRNNSNGHHNGNNGHHNGGNRQRHFNSDAKKDLSHVTCYKCKKIGHYSNTCPENKPDDATKPNPFQKGQVNHLNVEEVMNEPDVVMGMFPLNSFTALVLFDTGASHSFISSAFVNKHAFSTKTIGRVIKVSSPGGELIVKTGCWNLILEIGKYKFPTHMVVLDSQGLDVILGMDWMTNYLGVIDCVDRAITLTTPEGRRIRYKCNMDFNNIRLNHLKGVSLEEVVVVQEYPDVFLDELPGMPPDRDIEFLIELLPGTCPIAKRPYPMSTDELKELKKQLGEQLRKGFIRESSSPWGAPVLFVEKKDLSQ